MTSPAHGSDFAPQPPPVSFPWSGPLGRAGARCGQILLIALVVAGALWILQKLSVVVLATLVALILASAVHPLVRWLAGKGWSRLLATLTAFLASLLILGGVLTGIVFAIRREWDELTASAADGWAQLQDFLNTGPLPFDPATIDAAVKQGTDYASSPAFFGGALTGLTAASWFVTGAVLMLIILFFFLKDGPKMWSFVLRWFRGNTRARLAESGDRTIQILGGYVRGTAIIAAVDAIFVGVPIALLGIPLALPLAVIVFAGGFIPIVGATLAATLAALVALVTKGPLMALIVVAIIVVVNQLEGDFLQPVVMGRTLRLHGLVVLIALAIGTILGGVFGALLAVPFTAVSWAVVQVWTNAYQAGPDPVLGEDPLSPKNRVSARASISQRWNYARMRTQTSDTPSKDENMPVDDHADTGPGANTEPIEDQG